MDNPRARFQELLRELFQFDCADLDFGIYRILNHKREVIERFIEHDLLDGVAAELGRGALAAQSEAARALDEAKQRVVAQLGEGALLSDGCLIQGFQATPAGSEYLRARQAASGAQGREAIEAAIFNHLYSFFSRYYDAGDFMSKRRYSKRERYALPYNGEEVYLHWANQDQYYVKTTEYFRDYSYKHRDVTVRFRIREADVEQDNVKGKHRYFLPRTDEATYDESKQELVLPFDFRPLSQQESIAYGSTDQQDKIVVEAVTRLLTKFDGQHAVMLALTTEHRRTTQDVPVSLLEHHLRRYAAKNTSDYFIHTNLRGFMTRELDFYLKNEVLNLGDVEAGGDVRADGWFQMLQTIRAIGTRIIAFLAQVEDFQKRLFEKRKFITETSYLITTGNIPTEFHAEIAANDGQWCEWKELLRIDEEHRDLFTSGTHTVRRTQFLRAHPTLVLDTKNFDAAFVDRLLATLEDQDDMTDGLLIHSENWQALCLMTEKYRNKVECVYIDPPYNSPSTEILYKNDYKHSCWASLISCRIAASRPLFGDGVYVLAIDENEQERLGLVLNQSFLGTFKKTCVCIRHNPRGIQGRNFSYCHDFAYFLYPTDTKKYIGERPLEEPDDRTLRDSGLESDRTDARNCFYPFLVKSGKIVGIGDVPSDDFHPSAANEKTDAGATAIWPIDSRKDEKKWRYARQTVETILPKLHVTRANGRLDVHYAKDTGTFRTMWTEAKYDASEYGTKLLQNMFGRKDIDFTYPKSLHTLEDTIRATTRSTEGSMCLDYFAGSGTTAHAIISVNREDGGRRKFILVEIGNYFDTVLLPRVKKVTFAPEWKNGMPARTATAEEAERSPRVVKCVRLESYEDALNNIAFSNGSQQAMRFDDYALTYMLDFETRGSETLLSVDRLSSPFSYKLHVYDDGETKEKPVDLAETFSFLIGLRIKSRRVLYDGDRRYLVYRGMAAEKNTCVIWRDTKDWGQPEFDRDRQFVSQQQLTDGAEVVLVNCDSLIPNAQSLDPVFKRLMFAPVEQ